jgi:hypothetical protein
MANQIASFASGSVLKIIIDGSTMAYATNLSFSDDVSHAAVGGIGSFSYDALEPLQYLARGSFSLMRHSQKATALLSSLPERMKQGGVGEADGNSMLKGNSFNPSQLLLSKTFDINVYEKGANDTLTDSVFTIHDCRLTSYSITFTPGQTVSENIGFICLRVQDHLTQA